jgi:hypothetical protein
MIQKMNEDVGFLSNPWEAETLSYPVANRLFYPLNDKCYVSKESPSGRLVFFVTAQGEIKIDLSNKYKTFSLHTDNSNNSTHLICTLNDVNFSEYFVILAKSIAKDTCGLEGQVLFEKTIDVVNDMSSLFKTDNKKLTFSEYIGFWGELYFLFFELMPNIDDPKKAIDYWIGPTGKKQNTAKQDFTFDDLAFEIKTTMAGSSKDIKISSKDQLDKITDKLYLAHLFINRTDSLNGYSLQDLFNLIQDKLPSNQNSDLAFSRKAEPFMSRANHEQLNDKLHFTGLNIYDVNEDFPKLTHEEVGESILDVKYTISSASIKSFLIDESIGDIIK